VGLDLESVEVLRGIRVGLEVLKGKYVILLDCVSNQL
jgi:hypothetical protein